jgi:tetratricopeptide (TPR) repeat protein
MWQQLQTRVYNHGCRESSFTASGAVMSFHIRLASTLVAMIVLTALPQGQAPEPHVHSPSGKVSNLGLVTFANSGRSAAQEPFLRGLALLHSFEYDEAAAGFRDAQQADPGLAIAYWGEALTYSHLLWGEDDPVSARAALARLAPTPAERLARAGTPRERAFGVAVEALFVDADLPSRVRSFADSMRTVAAEYPDDPDAAAFASLALMFAAYEGQLPPEQRATARADAIAFAERVFRTSPEHPGGTHYLIHATDSPATAQRGLDAARRYAALAPDAEHALHMPSHIFLQLGMWDDTVASNERAWAASRAEVTNRKLTNADLSFHALQWLQYGYLQQGRYGDSRRLIQTARDVLSDVDLSSGHHVDARYAVGWMQFVHAANTGEWSGPVCEPTGRPVGPLLGTSGREQYLRGTAAYQRVIVTAMCGSTAAARKLAADMTADSANDKTANSLLTRADAHAMVIGYLRGEEMPAQGLAIVGNHPDQPLVGPPATLRTNELMGEFHTKRGRPAEAVDMYMRALDTTPNRAAALLGLARARKAAGDAQGADAAYKQLQANWNRADADVAALKEARGGS